MLLSGAEWEVLEIAGRDRLAPTLWDCDTVAQQSLAIPVFCQACHLPPSRPV